MNIRDEIVLPVPRPTLNLGTFKLLYRKGCLCVLVVDAVDGGRVHDAHGLRVLPHRVQRVRPVGWLWIYGPIAQIKV